MPGNIDLFDFLSDSLLILIVSFLPFKEAAKTSILSKRWRYIWHSTRNIEFNESSFSTHHVLPTDGREAQKHVFVDYIRKWMSLYQEPKVDRFRLSISYPYEFHAEIEMWLRAVINRNVDELDLNFYWLGCEGRLPNVHIATHMRKLCMCHCYPLHSSFNISMPSLRSFKYFGSVRGFQLQELTSIEEADLDFGLAYGLPNRRLASISPPLYLEARHLIIKVGLLAKELLGIVMLLIYCPMLDTLSVKLGFGRQVKVGPYGRKFNADDHLYEINLKAFLRRHEVHFQGLKEKLKVVEVEGYRGSRYEEELVHFLMEEAQVLEKITITSMEMVPGDQGHPDKYFQNAQRVLGFGRASHSLTFSINSGNHK
ncbi:hypothetical protein NE237_001814 [Protea cynaroides]|uniref:F-box domain-containing protein n=1 Tax=Protea cynaroides TaxID=273540 RepID=A0A9Q0QYG5_9MAGN|nr:hypothetical protein NE237_001814 [Protea cynaroides]